MAPHSQKSRRGMVSEGGTRAYGAYIRYWKPSKKPWVAVKASAMVKLRLGGVELIAMEIDGLYASDEAVPPGSHLKGTIAKRASAARLRRCQDESFGISALHAFHYPPESCFLENIYPTTPTITTYAQSYTIWNPSLRSSGDTRFLGTPY